MKPRKTETTEATAIINELFAIIKQETGIETDTALAAHFGTNNMMIYRLRQGRLPPSLKLIARSLVQYADKITLV